LHLLYNKRKAQSLSTSLLTHSNKRERTKLNEGSKHSHGALAIGQTAIKLEMNCGIACSYKHQQRCVSPKDNIDVKKLLDFKQELWKCNRTHMHHL